MRDISDLYFNSTFTSYEQTSTNKCITETAGGYGLYLGAGIGKGES